MTIRPGNSFSRGGSNAYLFNNAPCHRLCHSGVDGSFAERKGRGYRRSLWWSISNRVRSEGGAELPGQAHHRCSNPFYGHIARPRAHNGKKKLGHGRRKTGTGSAGTSTARAAHAGPGTSTSKIVR